jgi:hypothetical protein
VVRWIQTKAALRAHGGGQLDEFGIATGAEREELEAKREGKKRFDLDPPRGPFGTQVRFWILYLTQLSVKLLNCQSMLTASYIVYNLCIIFLYSSLWRMSNPTQTCEELQFSCCGFPFLSVHFRSCY